MINFHKELQKLDVFSLDKEFIDIKNETCILFSSLTKASNKLDKKLADISTNVEELFSMVEDENKASNNLSRDLDLMKRTHANDINAFVSAFVGIADMIEDMYIYAKKSDDSSLIQQAQVMHSNLNNALSSVNIICIRGESSLYNPFLQTIVQVDNSSNEPYETVLQVLRSGYIYNNKVIRKASVIVKSE